MQTWKRVGGRLQLNAATSPKHVLSDLSRGQICTGFPDECIILTVYLQMGAACYMYQCLRNVSCDRMCVYAQMCERV